MILSSFIIGLAFAWLLAETEFLSIRLQAGKTPEPNIETPKRKQRPIIEPCTATQVKTCSYPVVLLLPEMCGFTKLQTQIVKEKWRIDADNPYHYNTYDNRIRLSYQQMIIGGHEFKILATSHKLYDTIAEAQKVADSKTRSESYSKLRQTKEPMTCKMIYNPDSGNDEPNYESNCLFPIEWLQAHYQDIIPEPTIDLIIDGVETHFNGNFKTGCIKELIKIKRGK